MIVFRRMAAALLAVVIVVGVTVKAAAVEPPFGPGEVIHYSVKQLGVKVGEATLAFSGDTYSDGKKFILVVFTAKGATFYDEERIFLDQTSFLPLKVLRDLNIFGNKETILEEYDQAQGVVRITKTADGKTTVQSISKPGPVENLYGFLYRTRLSGAVSVGKSLDMRLPTVNVRLEGREALKFNAAGQSFAAVRMQSVPSKYMIWFDVGQYRLPLRIAGALGPANTVMTMISVESGKELKP